VHVVDVGPAGLVATAEHRPVVATAPDRAVSLHVERLRIDRMWDAATFADRSRDSVSRRVPGLAALTTIGRTERWWCTSVLEEGALPDGRRVLALHAAHAGFAHRLIAVVDSAAPSVMERSRAWVRDVDRHLVGGGLDPELQPGGVLDAYLWAGQGEQHLLLDDAAPQVLRELVAGIVAARDGSESRTTWLDPDVVACQLDVRPYGGDVELGVSITPGGAVRSQVDTMTGRCSWSDLAAGVASGLQRLLDQEDAAGYRAAWLRSWFPVAELEQLMALVIEHPPPLRLDLPADWSLELEYRGT